MKKIFLIPLLVMVIGVFIFSGCTQPAPALAPAPAPSPSSYSRFVTNTNATGKTDNMESCFIPLHN